MWFKADETQIFVSVWEEDLNTGSPDYKSRTGLLESKLMLTQDKKLTRNINFSCIKIFLIYVLCSFEAIQTQNGRTKDLRVTKLKSNSH